MQLTENQIPILIIIFVIYVLFTVVNVFLKLKPPINFPSEYGYRTPLSLKNKENWDFANKLTPNVFLVSFHIFAIVFSALVFLKSVWFTHVNSPLIVILGMVTTAVLSIWYIEAKLKMFDSKNSQNSTK